MLMGVGVLILVPVPAGILIGLILLGLGCAPIFPSLLHATPTNFGKQSSQAMMGIQMASAYTGTTLMPPLFGFLSGITSTDLLPYYLLLFVLLMTFAIEYVNRLQAKANKMST